MANKIYSPDEFLFFNLKDMGDGTYAFPVYDRTGDGSTTTPVAAGVATDTVIKATPGQLVQVLVTATGTNPMQIFDNAAAGSGTIIGALPASPAVGAVYAFNMPAANGITVKGNAANPAVTISFA